VDRFDRNIRFFGREGQDRLGERTLAIVGVGGLGTHVVQQSALLGFGGYALIDHQTLDATNLNRYVGVFASDVGSQKTALASRIIKSIDPSARVEEVRMELQSRTAFEAIRRADIVVGCLDTDGARLVCAEVAAAAGKPYVDLASDILPGKPMQYGGRVVFSFFGDGCILCRGLIDIENARFELDANAAAAHEAIYGVPRGLLRDEVGPAVVSINGVVASLAVTELMLHATRVRPPRAVLTYRAEQGKVLASTDGFADDCYYCKGIFGRWDAANVEKYLADTDTRR
jgi:molybdopterin-synthase adenylyltransferase